MKCFWVLYVFLHSLLPCTVTLRIFRFEPSQNQWFSWGIADDFKFYNQDSRYQCAFAKGKIFVFSYRTSDLQGRFQSCSILYITCVVDDSMISWLDNHHFTCRASQIYRLSLCEAWWCPGSSLGGLIQPLASSFRYTTGTSWLWIHLFQPYFWNRWSCALVGFRVLCNCKEWGPCAE